MKKSLLILSAILTISLCACSSSVTPPDATPASEESEAEEAVESAESADDNADETDNKSSDEDKTEEKLPGLKDVLSDKAGVDEADIIDIVERDYDGDGSKEAFAITGKEIDEFESKSLVEGSAWYVTQDSAEKLLDSEAMGLSDTIRIMVMGDSKYALIDEMYATAIVTHVFTVSDKSAVEAPFSAKGELITGLDEDEAFRIMDSSYDMMYDDEIGGAIGHTWKHYYFFYDNESDKIYEYGGTDISREDAEYVCGRDLIGELIAPSDKVEGMFLRGNGLLVLNYTHPVDGGFENHHYIYDILHGKFVDDCRDECGEEPQDGICLAALCPDIAYFPELPVPQH